MKNICPLSDLIHGLVKPGFEPIREGFIRTFTQRREVGAALICWSYKIVTVRVIEKSYSLGCKYCE